MLTHQVSVDPARRVVIKRFRQAERSEPEREWRALTLLAEHAPGLAPQPVLADLAADPPVIEMSLLPGEPLGGQPLTAEQESALVRAVGQLWQSVPVSRVIPLPGEAGNEAQLVTVVRQLAAQAHDLGDDPVVRAAHSAGLTWLSWAVGESGQLAGHGGGSPDLSPVFGQGDANLANFLWDGQRVRVVDFEDSGLSDRAFEIAALIEHLSAWSDSTLDGGAFIRAFDLSTAERARLADCRRLTALFWYLNLRPGGDASARNPAGTLRRQAERLLALL
ncbi:MAG TPA: aminoglycoside phosphotransferase family protein [Streptosporangiaceae bacterium]|nr:aminoglycoside phosphotransferase family protein [Streptosporangiaceae bacterium]